jgi:drug/metabolite transporter (DMT)-like permease
VLLLSAALAVGFPLTGCPSSSYVWMTLVALISQVMGHSSLNWALAQLNATVACLSVRAAPVIATALAVPVLDEVPRWTVFPGGLLILVSVYLAVRAGAPSQRRYCAV